MGHGLKRVSIVTTKRTIFVLHSRRLYQLSFFTITLVLFGADEPYKRIELITRMPPIAKKFENIELEPGSCKK